MATLYAYPLATPKNADLMVGTSIPLPNTNKDEQARTVNFSVSSIVALISTATGAQTFQQVTNIGQVAIGVDSVSITTNNIKIGGIFFDSASIKGTANQILTSNAAGKLIWSDAAATGVTKITAGTNLTITPAGGTGDVTINASGSLTTVTGTLPITTSGGDAGVRNVGINTMGVANASTAGVKGAVPASLAGDQLKFLRADATWQVPDNTTYSISIPDTTTKLRLTGASPASTDDIEFVGGGITTVSRTNENKFTITSTEADTLQSVTTRGATSNQAITLSNNLLINGTGVGSVTLAGTGVGGYLYITGNSGPSIPSHPTGIALAYNNSAGQRESELFWNTGADSNTPAINNVSFFGIYNEFIDSTSGDARVTTNQVKLYGTGSFELTRPNASLITPHFSSPIVAGTNNSLLARSNTKQTAFTTTLTYNETNATLAILPASGTDSEIQMKSPNNGIWKLNISNAGALVVTGPF
jgi:hypothetical protein